LQSVAVPGTSEHHLGLAVDIIGKAAQDWLSVHCWEYGFILRYTGDKAAITGIIDEPWHFRYVGTEVSMDMKGSGLCLEEYLGAA
jgi:D-alanyl-D-alanine carboxypeptidase